MNIVRKLLLFVIIFGFSGILFLNAVIWTARMTIMDRDVTKNWLSQSNVYDNFVDELANLVKEDQSKRGGGSESNFDTEALTRGAKQAFPPETLKKHVEYVLNATYDWLEQKTSVLVIDMDFSQEKKDFIESLGDEGLSRITDLPACGADEPVDSFDIFSATCLPSGTNAAALVNSFKSEIATSEDILPDTSINTSDITIDYKGKKQRLDTALSEVPIWYGLLTVSPFVLSGLIVVNSALIILLNKPKLRGLKTLGWLFGVIGGLQMIVGLAGMLLRETIVRNTMGGEVEKGLAENILLPVIREVSFSIGKWNLIIGGIYVLLSVVLALVYISQRRKDPEAGDIEKKEPENPSPVEEKPQDVKLEEKEVKKPSLVQ